MNCKFCLKLLPADVKSNRKFCDSKCSSEYNKREWRRLNPKSPLGQIATCTAAEVNESLVAIDLLKRGYEVYRAAFQGMPCDMLIGGGKPCVEQWGFGTTVRVEVTGGSYSANGTVVHPFRDPHKFDVLAVVIGEKIFYKPELT